VIVIAEPDADFLAGFTGFIKKISGALPASGLGALFFVNPGTNDVAVADNLCGFESLGPLFFDNVVTGVARRRG